MTTPTTILVVDDDPNILVVLEARLSAAGFSVIQASDGLSALKTLKETNVDLMISDMKMPEMSGMDLFWEVRKQSQFLPIIFLTAYGTIPDAVMAVKAGAVDYISKPFDGKELVAKVNSTLQQNAGPPDTSETPLFEDGFYWGTNPVMQELHTMTKKVGASNVNVLILGESGVGKECIAKAVHNHSSRRGAAYMVVDCGSTPPGILESELFGHMRGAFTNAVQDKPGLIEAADGGTLFLDEIGNISSEMQSRLLRFLEERKIRRVGAIKEISVDCRVVSATNADLPLEIKEGNFRQDLYYRLRVITINVPPLRERKEDIAALARFLVKKQCDEQGLPPVEIPEETIAWMENHQWPGNVRELKNALEAGVVLCRNNKLLPDDLQLAVAEESTEIEAETTKSFSIERSEKEAIIRALKQTNGVQKRAAELLDISRRSIHYKIKKYNIQVADYK
ncbi:sigma-54-dependent transcriptional regulator [Desulfopila inferna]|uniref:sigma-54-dependent transcriptional regulator n=1 Tax=Desulfopila inferna TaxID=468528 RepID=UPI0019622BC6|nr:sigma-54 dependent transcriptional regulator [Desulfopila inferna]MBM9606391.1 sigma-54-dependent Fis family transcriptional regulator [Desulfopila inferna]